MEFYSNRYASGEQPLPESDTPQTYPYNGNDIHTDPYYRYKRYPRKKYLHSRNYHRRPRRNDQLLRVIFTFIIQLLGLLWILGFFD